MAFLLAVMTLLTALQVILRYLFNTSLLWSLEATTYCFAWLVLVGMAYGVRTRSHIAIDLLVNSFEPRARRILGLIATLICLVYSLMMLFGALEFTQRLFILGNQARDLPVERWLLTIMLPVGFGLLFLRFVQMGVAIWRGRATGLTDSEAKVPDFLPGLEPQEQDRKS